jgi:hypothetical protein
MNQDSLSSGKVALLACTFYDGLVATQGIRIMLFTNGGTCLFDIIHSALWGSEYPVCTPDAQVLFLSGGRMLYTQHSAVQALPSGVQTAKAPFLTPAPSSSTQTPFPSREKSAVFGIRTGDLSDQSQAL